MSRFLIYVIVFIEGFCSLGAEVIALRRLVPHVGSSIVITAPTIGFFLLALVLGYASGAKVAGNYLNIVDRNLLIAAALAGIGLAGLSVDWMFAHLQPVLVAYLVFIGGALGLLVGALLLAQRNFKFWLFFRVDRGIGRRPQSAACSHRRHGLRRIRHRRRRSARAKRPARLLGQQVDSLAHTSMKKPGRSRPGKVSLRIASWCRQGLGQFNRQHDIPLADAIAMPEKQCPYQ